MEGGKFNMSILKDVVLLNGEIINVGEWDFNLCKNDETGEEIVGNPLPEGAILSKLEMKYTKEDGWREINYKKKISDLEILEAKILYLSIMSGVEI